jgi:prepilin peptidase dependent protein B
MSRSRAARGLSLVELMVGIAVGLMVVAGASFVAVNQIGDNRRLLLETQIQQDLRAAADMVARDLRRAGYWGAAESGVWEGNDPSVAPNPYRDTSPDAPEEDPVTEVTFSYSRDAAGAEDGAVDDDRERFGFKLEGGVIRMRLGGAWQALTDGNLLEVTRFDVNLNEQAAQQACFNECPGGGTACWPTQAVRRFTVDIAGRAVADPAVVRSVRESVRLRNDITGGACPP